MDTDAGRAQSPDPATLPRGQRERRRRILHVAAELLRRDEFERIQIRDIAEGSEVALGTVYRYFPSKEQLYAEVLRDWSAGDPIKDDGPDRAVPPAERVRARLHHSVDRMGAEPTYLRLQNHLRQSTDPAVLALYTEFSDQVLLSYRGELFDLPEDDARDIVAILTGVLSHHLTVFAHGRNSLPEIHRLLDRAVDLVFSTGPAARPDRR